MQLSLRLPVKTGAIVMKKKFACAFLTALFVLALSQVLAVRLDRIKDSLQRLLKPSRQKSQTRQRVPVKTAAGEKNASPQT